MVRNITLSQFLTLKEKKVFTLFIFFLGDEYSYLGNESTWLHTLHVPVYIVRMSEEEFHTMDFAVHPKVIGTKSGKEVFELNGFPNIRYLQEKISKI